MRERNRNQISLGQTPDLRTHENTLQVPSLRLSKHTNKHRPLHLGKNLQVALQVSNCQIQMFVCFLCVCSRMGILCKPEFPEYEAIEGYDIIQVQVLTRHGLRTSLHVPPKFSNIWRCRNSRASTTASRLSNTVKVHISDGKSVFLGNCFVGELIGKGADGLCNVGNYMKQVYIVQLKFLPSIPVASIARFRTTATLRTISSQMNFVKCMYPDGGVIEIELAEKTSDVWKQPETFCPNMNVEMERLKNSPDFQTYINKSFVEEMHDLTGAAWRHTYDALVPPYCENLSLPNGVDFDTLQRVASAKAVQGYYVFNHETMRNFSCGFMSADILNQMIKRINGESQIRFIYWSAHDVNVISLLGYLGYKDTTWPPFGSYIQVELLKNRVSGNFGVCFRYNGKIIESDIFNNQRVVDFHVYQQYVIDHVPSLEICGFNSTAYMAKHVHDPITI